MEVDPLHVSTWNLYVVISQIDSRVAILQLCSTSWDRELELKSGDCHMILCGPVCGHVTATWSRFGCHLRWRVCCEGWGRDEIDQTPPKNVPCHRRSPSPVVRTSKWTKPSANDLHSLSLQLQLSHHTSTTACHWHILTRLHPPSSPNLPPSVCHILPPSHLTSQGTRGVTERYQKRHQFEENSH